MAKATILIVEDEIIVGRDLQRALERLGYDAPVIAVSGKMALKHAARLQPDLVLMDIVLKGYMDGIDTAEQLASEYEVPIIYLTAHSDRYTVARARMTRPSGYILKPYDEAKLREAIDAALEFRRGERAARQHPPRPSSVLVVDPDTQRQAVVTSLLSQRDHRVKLAGRGDHAAQMLREAPVDLIVLELELPDGRGEELVRRLRRDMGLETPVIVLTAQITRDSIALLKSEGVTAFVTRSSDYEFRLMSEVQAVLGGGPPQQSAAADPPDAAGDDWAADL